MVIYWVRAFVDLKHTSYYSKLAPSYNKSFILEMKRSKFLVLLILLVNKTVRGLILGELGEGWHYMVRGLNWKDLQNNQDIPTRSPRQIIGSR